ncbi:Cob(I)alamin adenosyltransferase PduO [Fulvivirga imtechensis AK7]|uniref:Corrinoid adenosyltransferase n=1 Tax=Fulvivirga imtechensis AK7 TaxID=1237149 RepID=L8JJL5_9BACT|nr:cob(I)yrinic acid a,c-diamide adenosyltransferase [Fulvivirga imtechensis]ELR69101.1 Cob(I)alamin adenosyltransferase PduO [Fulvivirga imtechensis AK7]
MKVYTKTGDKGTTALFGGARVSKSHDRINAYGTIDELNSYIGLVRDQEVNHKRRTILVEVQDRLFTIGSVLATEPGNKKVKTPHLGEDDIEALEVEIDKMEEELPPMKNFILPGGHPSVSFCHVARCVCRRAERLVVALNDHEAVNPLVIQYLNRLSDYLFVLARKMSKELNAEETPWKARM